MSTLDATLTHMGFKKAEWRITTPTVVAKYEKSDGRIWWLPTPDPKLIPQGVILPTSGVAFCVWRDAKDDQSNKSAMEWFNEFLYAKEHGVSNIWNLVEHSWPTIFLCSANEIYSNDGIISLLSEARQTLETPQESVCPFHGWIKNEEFEGTVTDKNKRLPMVACVLETRRLDSVRFIRCPCVPKQAMDKGWLETYPDGRSED